MSLSNINGLNIDAALKNCGSEKLLLQMLSDFQLSIEAKSNEIEDLFENKNYSDFRIKVHALKSTSRLIGALKLSELAETLEHAAQIEDLATIQLKTPRLLALYRSFSEILKDYIQTDNSENEKDIISIDTFNDLTEKLVTGIEEYDYTTLENVQKELGQYELQLDFYPIYDKIVSCINNVDFQGVSDLLPEIKVIKEGDCK